MRVHADIFSAGHKVSFLDEVEPRIIGRDSGHALQAYSAETHCPAMANTKHCQIRGGKIFCESSFYVDCDEALTRFGPADIRQVSFSRNPSTINPINPTPSRSRLEGSGVETVQVPGLLNTYAVSSKEHAVGSNEVKVMHGFPLG